MQTDNLFPLFQPIVSVSRKLVCGVEGLIRGTDPATGAVISPRTCFRPRRTAAFTLELDRMCRKKILESFRSIYLSHPDNLLFLNIDASILEQAAGSNHLYRQVRDLQFNPGNIVIEINETKVHGSAALKKFADTYRKHNFLIALDDVGTGFSNLDRVLLVKPDIIKIDISLVRNIHQDYYKQGVFKSLINLSNKIGALTVAEGVETREEAIAVLRLGCHMIQGFFFSEPSETYEQSVSLSTGKIGMLSRSFSEYMNRQCLEENNETLRLQKIVRESAGALTDLRRKEFNNKLVEIIRQYQVAECLYVLDEFGTQVSDTVCTSSCCKNSNPLIFYSSRSGTDHSMDNYYYPLIYAKLEEHITEPYISLATGNLCITYSKVFRISEEEKFILCMDFRTSEEKIASASPLRLGPVETKPGAPPLKMGDEIVMDDLTDAFNRRYIEQRLMLDVFHASANGSQPVSVLKANIDHFKHIVEGFGRAAGDQALRDFVSVTKHCIRKSTDWVARFGGDEFLIVLMNADKEIAFLIAEKIRKAMEQSAISHLGLSFHYTASFGVYTVCNEAIAYEELIRCADRNLCLAKQNGRNRTVG
jgi:diguanylate cyclase (GGDEF)-like protein